MSNDSIEDKVVLARRGALSDHERRRLEIALNTSESTRALHAAGIAFDRMHTDAPSDDALLTRVSARTSARVLGGRARNPRRLGRLTKLAAAVLMVSGAAAASLWHLERTGSSRPVESPITRTPSEEATNAARPDRGAVHPASNEQVVSNDGADEPDDNAAAPSPAATSPTPPVVTHREAPSIEDAGGLFKNANDARKAGDPERALALYQTLRRRFPASPEAQISLVLAGRLLLASGQASRALSLFDQYLKAGAPGGLAEEALSGKAHALAELGRTAEERQVWRQLLRQFPKSVYVRKARERLR